MKTTISTPNYPSGSGTSYTVKSSIKKTLEEIALDHTGRHMKITSLILHEDGELVWTAEQKYNPMSRFNQEGSTRIKINQATGKTDKGTTIVKSQPIPHGTII